MQVRRNKGRRRKKGAVREEKDERNRRVASFLKIQPQSES